MDLDATDLSEWINDPGALTHKLGEQNYVLFVEDILRQFPFLRDNFEVPIMDLMRSPIYYGIGAKLSCLGQNMNFIKESVAGHYKIYRPSMKAPKDHSFVGRLEIRYDQYSNSFLTREQYRIPQRRLAWDMPGVFFPDSRDRYLTLALDEIDQSVQLKCFRDLNKVKAGIASNPKQISSFTGWVADMVGTKYYTTRIFAESIDKSMELNLRTMPNKKLPLHVREHFSKPFASSHNEYIFED